MGVIQGSINNLLTVAAASARLSPGLEKRAYETKYGQTEKFLEATDYEGYSHEIAKTQAERSMKIAELSPTEENIKRYLADASAEEAMRPENIEAEREYLNAKKATDSGNIYDYETERAAKNLVKEYYQDPQEKADLAAARALIQEQKRVSRSKNMRGGNQ